MLIRCTSPGTLARTLIDDPQLEKVILKLTRKVRLEGYELEDYRRKELHHKIEKVKVEETSKYKALTVTTTDGRTLARPSAKAMISSLSIRNFFIVLVSSFKNILCTWNYLFNVGKAMGQQKINQLKCKHLQIHEFYTSLFTQPKKKTLREGSHQPYFDADLE